MSRFLNEMENRTNTAQTENGALVYETTRSDVLDFFATGGAMRNQPEDEVIKAFSKAYSENALLALKALFYFRDVRGGQGERKTFRTLVTWLANHQTVTMKKNLRLIAEFGRWDDLYSFVGTPLEKQMFDVIGTQLLVDSESETPSLLAKWLKSENASSPYTKRLGKLTRKALGMSPKQYRKTLSALRKKIDLVEQRMSKGEWKSIQYDKLPSKAGLVYRKAFNRNDSERYMKFLDDVKKGTKKINAGTLYPYEIVEKVKAGMYSTIPYNEVEALDAMWDSLPNYFGESNTRGLVVADTSGSMSGRPMDVAISLALYTAERNKGEFHNKFITFSTRPKLQTVKGNNIVEKVYNLSRADWDMNTNIKAVFDLVLNVAIDKELSQDELPTHLYIVSDMQYDRATQGKSNARLFETIRERFTQAGYEMPFLVFWNVRAVPGNQPMSMDERGFQLVSGCSPSIFTSLLSNSAVSAYDLMLEVLNSERYSAVTV